MTTGWTTCCSIPAHRAPSPPCSTGSCRRSGDPLADVGLFYVYWQDASDSATQAAAGLLPSVTRLPGFPTRRELLDRYAARTGRDLSALPWYVGFACFKLAVVLAGVAARGRAGAMIGDGFVEMAARIPPLVEVGHSALSGNLA